MKTTIEKQEKQMRKQLHVLRDKIGMSDYEYKAMLFGSFGVDSSVDLNAHQLIDLIHTLEKQVDGDFVELDRWRKRVMASIGGYPEAQGMDSDIAKIKSIACRASECKTFNAIPKQKLIAVYYAFANKQNVIKNVENIISGTIPEQYMPITGMTAIEA